ncbi:MAG: hypothetical protein JSU87_00970 [Gemmatimonadota bacterium]|nr:MAG: hypothetical protein JSU87_00970 [Gemmatimonadota bacterium]
MQHSFGFTAILLVAALTVGTACGGDREGAQEGEAANEMEIVADESDEKGSEVTTPDAVRPTTTECQLSEDYFPLGAGDLEFRIPVTGNPVRAWQFIRMEGDQETVMNMISKDGALSVSQVDAPIGSVHYTQHAADDSPGASTYLFDFALELDARWWKGELSFRALSPALAASCAQLVPQTLASLRRQ